MCDPITIGAMALAAGGSAINGIEQHNTQNSMIEARNAATRAELERQRKMQAQAGQIFNDTQKSFEPESQAKALTDQQTAVTDNFQGGTPTATDIGSISSAGAPRVVKEAADKKVGDVFNRASKLNTSLGTLRGYDQNFFNNNVNLNDSARKLGTVSDLARTSAAVNGLEQNAAYRNAYKPNSGIGDILGFAGNIGAYGAGKGWFNPLSGAKTTAFSPMTSAGAIY